MSDIIQNVNGSIVQHGKYNDRIYLMKLGSENTERTIDLLEEMVHENDYSKAVAKIPQPALESFEQHGYVFEAKVPGLYKGSVDGYFVAKYFSEDRQLERHPDEVIDTLLAAEHKSVVRCVPELPLDYTYSTADECDAEEISAVYRQVFQSYPFPISETDYVRQTMRENVVYFCVKEGGRIVSVASSEMDVASENVEMTDFATLPDFRRNGFAVFLLHIMDGMMKLRGMRTAYTIARSLSHGINTTFSKLGYEYGGTLANNTNICGNMESMNIWHKTLRPAIGE